MTQVGLAWMPSLCSSDTQRRSLRLPGLPSAPGRNLGTMNSEMPRTPGGASGVRPSTRCTMFSVVAGLDGAGLELRQVRARLRLGEVHGPRPFARDHLRQVGGLLLGRAVMMD